MTYEENILRPSPSQIKAIREAIGHEGLNRLAAIFHFAYEMNSPNDEAKDREIFEALEWLVEIIDPE
jgi:hypothetical protein